MNTNEVMLRKKLLTYLGTVPGSGSVVNGKLVVKDNIAYVATVVKNFESLGFTLSEDVIKCLRQTDADAIVYWYKDTVSILKQLVGANVKFVPMYKGFPEEVMEKSHAELYIDQMVHYVFHMLGMRVVPVSEERETFPLIDNKELKVIGLAMADDVHNLCGNIMSSNTSISEQDRAILEWYFTDYRELQPIRLSPSIPNKENLATVAKMLHFCGCDLILNSALKTATDVLRFAVALCDGDVSLAEKTKFRNFKRSERALILDVLNDCNGDIIEDMNRHRTAWIRLGEKLHPGDYSSRFEKAYEAFVVIRSGKNIPTFNSLIEELIAGGNVKTAAKILRERPGEFARRLDKLLRHCNDNTVLNLFDTIADSVSTPVLIQVRDHFKNRNSDVPRFCMPKGTIAKIYELEKPAEPVDDYTTDAVVHICEDALLKKFAKLPKLGKIYIDDRLHGYRLPQSQRSAAEALKVVPRGSKFKIDEDAKFLRFFLYWKGYCDIDLSAVFYDDKWNVKQHCSYTSLKNDSYGLYHSGDLRSAPEGAAEFIDVDIQKLKNKGVRYIAMDVLCFSSVKFHELEDCFAGWMTRQNRTGKQFEAKTVENRFDLSSDQRTSMPVIFDLKTMEAIWVDLSFGSSMWNNVEGNSKKIKMIGDIFSRMEKMSQFDLFTMHGIARGATFVGSREEADTVYAEDGDVKPTDLDVIASEYLA